MKHQFSIGDRVFVDHRNRLTVAKITKLTDTGVWASDSRYDAKKLTRNVGAYDIARIIPVTDERAIARFRAQVAQSHAAKVSELAAKFKSAPSEAAAQELSAQIEVWRAAHQRAEQAAETADRSGANEQ